MRLGALLIATALTGFLAWPAQSASGLPEMRDLEDKLGAGYPLNPDLPDSMLARPLTAGASVRIALARNPGIRALILEASLARADRSGSRRLPNPEVDGRFAQADGGSHIELAVLEDMTGFISYPWKRNAGNARYQAALSRLAAEVIGRTFEVRVDYFRAVAADQLRKTAAEAAGSFEAAAELARRQREAGTMSVMDLAQAEAAEAEAQAALETAEAEAEGSMERLGQAIGAPPSRWKLPDSLPEPPDADPDSNALQQAVRTGNHALKAAHEDALAAQTSATLSGLTFLPAFKAGVFVQEDPGEERLIGPAVALEIPIFDWGGPVRARAKTEREIAERRLASAAAALPAEMRASLKTMNAARRNHEIFRNRLLPLRKTATAEALKQYNFMLTGVYQVLATRREETAARRSDIEALSRYWIARSGLEMLAGGELPPAMALPRAAPPPMTPATPPSPSQPRHQHNGD